ATVHSARGRTAVPLRQGLGCRCSRSAGSSPAGGVPPLPSSAARSSSPLAPSARPPAPAHGPDADGPLTLALLRPRRCHAVPILGKEWKPPCENGSSPPAVLLVFRRQGFGQG